MVHPFLKIHLSQKSGSLCMFRRGRAQFTADMILYTRQSSRGMLRCGPRLSPGYRNQKNCSPPRAHLVTLLRAAEEGRWNHVPPSWKRYHCRMAAQSTSNWKMHSMCWAPFEPFDFSSIIGRGNKQNVWLRLRTYQPEISGPFADKLCGLRSGLVRVRL